jgi:hypothetical protein
MDKMAEALKERTKQFAIAVLEFAEMAESRELVAIFSKACVTARRNDRARQAASRQR